MNQVVHAEQEFAVILQQAESSPRAVMAFLQLHLNYLYGLEILPASKPAEAATLAMERGPSARATFMFQDREISRRNALLVLSRHGEMPLFVLVPPALVPDHRKLCHDMRGVFVCNWDQALGKEESSLQATIGRAFEAYGIAKLPLEAEGLPQERLQQRLERRLKHLTTLPTIPAIVISIMRMLRDPETTTESLAEVLSSDPAIVHRILKVVRSPTLAGTREPGQWSLKEAIARLGLKEVGAIAQQIRLINGLVKPESSPFDLHRFWAHSVGCAVIADRLCADKLLALPEPIPFDRYWIAALLHDLGKLVLGFFAWDYFQEVLDRMASQDMWFRQAEERLGHEVTHEYLGRLILLQANVDPELAEAVGSHNMPGRRPDPLVCLIHVADNLCRDLGLGYLSSETATYRATVLSTLRVSQEDMDGLRDRLAPDVTAHIEDLTRRCMQ